MSVIRVENLSKSFGKNEILKNVNVEIEQGEIVSVIGSSGTGKSTLLRAINFLTPPTAGNVFFNNVKIDKKNINEVRQKMGMVFQAFGLFSHLTVMENICAGPVKLLGMTREKAMEKTLSLLKTVGLTERAEHFPHQLSGGEKQRIAIARCLAMEPQVILFDEPTSALDPTMVGEVMAIIRNLSQTELTMLIVTHEMSFAKDISTRVLYMDEMGIYEEGTTEQIFNNPQKPKTQAFIYKIRSFYYKIDSLDFDYVAMLSGIDNFCFVHAVDEKNAKKLRLLAEELVINIVVPKFVHCELAVNFSEKLGLYEIEISFPGADVDVLETAGDDLVTTLIKGFAKDITHKYSNGINTLRITI